jgi:predicted nucleotidyltransferase
MRTSALVKTNIRPTGFPPVATTLPKAVNRLVTKLKPDKIILFGSYAYGNPTPDSDVDLLIVMEANGKDTYVAASLALYPRKFPVDIIVKTPKEVEEELKRKGNFFFRDIVYKGRVLYERRRRK